MLTLLHHDFRWNDLLVAHPHEGTHTPPGDKPKGLPASPRAPRMGFTRRREHKLRAPGILGPRRSHVHHRANHAMAQRCERLGSGVHVHCCKYFAVEKNEVVLVHLGQIKLHLYDRLISRGICYFFQQIPKVQLCKSYFKLFHLNIRQLLYLPQDTVVAMEALAEYAFIARLRDLTEIECTLDVTSEETQSVHLSISNVSTASYHTFEVRGLRLKLFTRMSYVCLEHKCIFY